VNTATRSVDLLAISDVGADNVAEADSSFFDMSLPIELIWLHLFEII